MPAKKRKKKQIAKVVNIKDLPVRLKGIFDISHETKDALDFIPESLKLKVFKSLSPIKLNREGIRVITSNLLLMSERQLSDLSEDQEETPALYRILANIISAAGNGDVRAAHWLLEKCFTDPHNKTKAHDLIYDESDENKKTIVILKDPESWSDEQVLNRQKKLLTDNIKAYEAMKEEKKES